MLAHPSEPDLPILAATDALAHGDRTAGRFINRALELAPSWTTPHAQAATWLWNGGHRSQALLELGVAVRGDIYGSRAIVCAIAARWSEGVASIASKTGNPVLFLEQAAQCHGVSGAIDEALLRYDPRSVSARSRQAQAALAVPNYDLALARAREALALDPGASAAALAEVEALRRLGRLAEARNAAERALRASPGAVQLRDVELQLLVQAGDRPALQKALAEMRSHANDAGDLAHAYLVEGASESALSNPGAAIRAYQQAYDIGGDPEPLRRAAVLAQSLGDSARARRAYAQLCAINPGDSESCTAMTSLAPSRGSAPSSSSPRSPIP
jgi:tetratricopeptide (TPR) repeat protein